MPSTAAAEPTHAASGVGRLAQVAALVLGVTILALCWRWGRTTGLQHLIVYLLSLLPGLPLAFALFGRRHAAGWIVGALLGHGLTASAIWIALATHSGVPPVAAWALAAGVGVMLGRVSSQRMALPPWRAADTLALFLVLLLVPTLLARPFSRIGEQDGTGRLRYRSYFTADFLWHVSLTNELAQLRLPPRDPYASPEPLHYYIAYFLVPASTVAALPHGSEAISGILRVNALGAGILLIAAVFLAGWAAVPRAAAIGWATALALLGASAEGAFACWRLWSTGKPLDRLRTLNVDAISAWWFHGPTIDGLPRALWYTPQHGAACALGLIAIFIAAAGGAATPLAGTLTAGLALALAVIFSPFIGGLFALVFGVAALIDALRAGDVRGLVRQSASAIPVVVAIGLIRSAHVLEGAGAALAFTLAPLTQLNSLTVIALALGPLLVVALVGAWARWRDRAMAPAGVALATGLLIFFTVSLAGTDPVWVGWRAGNLMLVTMPALAAAALVRLGAIRARAARTVAAGTFGMLLIGGSVTTAADWFNAQDLENEWPGPGFKWTLSLSPAQHAAFDWIAANAPRRAVVQMEPVARGRDGWTNVPAFSRHVMAAGLPISLVMQPYHRERAERVRRLYAAEDARSAWSEARAMHIDYLYLDAVDRGAQSAAAIAKFEAKPDLFQPAFAQDDVRVFAVAR
jgi:hypothetical protein